MDWSIFAFGATGWGDELLAGFGITLVLAVTSYIVGTALGTLFGLIELNAPAPVAKVFSAYAAVFRSVPELLVIFLIYYAGAFLLQAVLSLVGFSTEIAVGPFTAGIVALSIVQGAYTSEVVKGAVRAVPTGLVEAAHSLGMRPVAAFATVTLPLALRHAFPGLANLWMVVIKNTPFVSAIGVTDLIGQASTAGQNTKSYFAFFLAVLLVYLIVSAASMFGQLRIEKALYRYMDRAAG